MPTTRILVVDDDEIILKIISSYLDRNDGYDVLATSSPEEALEIVKNTPIDLLIADVMMPGMLGTRLFQEIKSIAPKTSCILISGYSKEMYNLPPDILFLQKPFNSEELLAIINEATAQSA